MFTRSSWSGIYFGTGQCGQPQGGHLDEAEKVILSSECDAVSQGREGQGSQGRDGDIWLGNLSGIRRKMKLASGEQTKGMGKIK